MDRGWCIFGRNQVYGDELPVKREIRRAKAADYDDVMDVYARARVFMAANGNPTQWGDSSPDAHVVMSDMEKNGYVVVEDNQIIGAFYFEEDAYEPVYDSIDGAWPDDAPYAVIHRCAVRNSSKGIGQFILDWCFGRYGNIRIDTHRNNVPMKNLLNKNGFEYCGKVQYNKDDGERVAYQKRIP